MTQKEFIAHKMPILIREGRSKEQAYAIAINMYKNMPKAQEGTILQKPIIDFPIEAPNLNGLPQATGSLNYMDLNRQAIEATPDEKKQRLNMARYNRDRAMGVWDDAETDVYYNDKIFNPFGEIGLDNALFYAGRGFGSGNVGEGVMGSALAGLKGARNFLSGYSSAKATKEDERDFFNRLYNSPINYQVMQGGGEVTNEEMLTGNYLTEMQGISPNVEVEDGEYVKNSQTGQIQEVVGETHDKGGVKVNLPKDSKVLSDYTKIGAELARQLSKKYDVKLKASHTFSDVMDKVNVKIGVTKLEEEEKEYLRKIEKQINSTIDERTKEINLKFLAKEMEELQSEKEQVNVIKNQIFEEIFQEQERLPKKNQLQKNKMQEGGVVEQFAMLTGENLEELLQKLEALPEEEKQQLLAEMQAVVDEMQPEQMMEEGGQTQDQTPPLLNKKQRQELLDFHYNQIKEMGYDGKKDIGEMQKWMVKNYPDEVVKYFGEDGEDLTAKHVDIAKNKFKDAFKTANIPLNKRSADYTVEEKKRLKQALGDRADKDFLLEGFQDNLWDRRFPLAPQKQTTSTPQPTATTTTQTPQQEEVITPQTEQERNSMTVDRLNMAMLPQPFILPPSALRGVYKPEVDLTRLEPIKISPESSLAAIEAQRLASSDLQFLPESQRASVMANMLGTTQNAATQATMQANNANAQMQFNTDQYNAQVADKEALLNTQMAQQYEAKMLGALRNTEIDLRNFYNQISAQNRQNFLDISTLNLMNQMTPNFKSTGDDVRYNATDTMFIDPKGLSNIDVANLPKSQYEALMKLNLLKAKKQ